MAKLDPEVLAHLEWLGFVQPTGLVVSAPALVRAGAILDRRDIEGQRLLRSLTRDVVLDPKAGAVPLIPDFEAFARRVLGWSFSAKAYSGTESTPIPPELELAVEGETLRPDFAVRELEPQSAKSQWQLVVRVADNGEPFDRPVRRGGALEMSEHSRMERLLRQTSVPAGLLFNGRVLRLLSAPYGESSGWFDFRVDDMLQTAGRPIATAMRLLLSEQRLLALPRAQRLMALLDDSRKFQNEVSERLAEQVLHALYELLRGFQHANDRTKGDLLRYTLADHPDEVYRGLLTVLLRLVFLLYAEERDMLPEDEIYLRNYSLGGLYERLREDAALYPDTMGERYGAWPQLLALFRIVHDGADAGGMRLPKRHGVLFDPDRYPFLEGRFGGSRQIHERIDPPLVPDRTLFEVLEKLLVLDGERISYRALDVEQIGSVYETMMGFELHRTTGPSIAIRAQKKQGAPTAIDLDELLGVSGDKREKWIAESTDRKLADKVKKEVKAATTLDELHAALLPVVDRAATPDLVPNGSMVLQPSEERRRSGSHYTPRSLTEPIVRTTLEPILKRLRGESDRPPKPEQILDLKVCDPAMGSGAFLVEACRQLGDGLVESWHAHDAMPQIPPDEDEVVYARRLVAQRCLYGVDRNPMAVDLAKVSLWLVTLAKEHSLTFVDHALRHGDSLVGLSRRQLEAFHWEDSQPLLKGLGVREPLDRYLEMRRAIREAGDEVTDRELNEMWSEANRTLADVRLFGDLVVFAFFERETAKEREMKRMEFADAAVRGEADLYREDIVRLARGAVPFAPFHWEVEFPEVFIRSDGGFDAVFGNPPFLGGVRLEPAFGSAWREFVVREIAEGRTGTRGAGDLAAYFLLRAFALLREGGAVGFVTTNSIGQGDTRTIGLAHLISIGADIYEADRSMAWPGDAGVTVARVALHKGPANLAHVLSGRGVDGINSFLREGPELPEAQPLAANRDLAFEGVILGGDGFIIDEAEARQLLGTHRDAPEVVLPFLSGQDVNSRPDSSPSRWAINFWDWPLDRGSAPHGYAGHVAADFPECLAVVRDRVLPFRLSKPPDSSGNRAMRERWWQYYLWRPALHLAIKDLDRVLVRSRVSSAHGLVFSSARAVLSDATIVFALSDWASFGCLQSRVHEEWARKNASTMRNDLRYTPTNCFQSFPSPVRNSTAHLASVAETYYEYRVALMMRRGEGLTKTYTRFNDADSRDSDIVQLRELHAAMDRAVLDAYGWTDIPTDCEFLLDYEIDEEEWGSKKKPYRYRWPDDVRDEVLARLLELNAERAREEARSGAAAQPKKTRKSKASRAAAEAAKSGEGGADQNSLFRR